MFSSQCTSDKNGSVIDHDSIKIGTDNVLDDDTVTPADLTTFAWQIAKGMVRAGLRVYCRDWPITLNFVMLG